MGLLTSKVIQKAHHLPFSAWLGLDHHHRICVTAFANSSSQVFSPFPSSWPCTPGFTAVFSLPISCNPCLLSRTPQDFWLQQQLFTRQPWHLLALHRIWLLFFHQMHCNASISTRKLWKWRRGRWKNPLFCYRLSFSKFCPTKRGLFL